MSKSTQNLVSYLSSLNLSSLNLFAFNQKAKQSAEELLKQQAAEQKAKQDEEQKAKQDEELLKQQAKQEALKTPEQKKEEAIGNIVNLYNSAINPQNGNKPSCEEALKTFLAQDMFKSASDADKTKLSKAFKGMYSAYNGEEIKDVNKIDENVNAWETLYAFVREIIRICLVLPAVAKFVFGNDSDSLIRGYRSTRENKNDFAAAKKTFVELEQQKQKSSNSEISSEGL